jgi:hypothetical protein
MHVYARVCVCVWLSKTDLRVKIEAEKTQTLSAQSNLTKVVEERDRLQRIHVGSSDEHRCVDAGRVCLESERL